MTDPRFEDLPVPAVHHKRGRPSAVWLVPILALLAAGGLALRTYLQSGPTIRITFENAEGLEAGIIGINDPVPATPQCPFGGMKESGMGRELGHEGLEAYLETKYVSFKLRD